ncbi:hypothetical protein SNOG_16540 [Parastagonospora nodorum SN15]|uniref:Uncharacterized protein n=1 Tax=Phaeosphaeria nodorum (strain SN15 / ATCC MYA-4574 / FGSC 10173) TaxID=321614 RepID=Q0TVC4_PHANO|nr:hypothetical protein SNOG_16540 [Parastagonospora nodorum SN15]EAT76080.1 hypothetical protein SNOG_16540 [Parastagonospora nodorum SN15]
MVFAVVGGGPRTWVAGLGDLFVASTLEPYWTLVTKKMKKKKKRKKRKKKKKRQRKQETGLQAI